MKILFITQLLPSPADTGGKIKTLETLKLLSKKHDIHLVCFTSDKKDLINVKNIKKICKEAKIFVWPLTTARYQKIKKHVLRNFFTSLPFTVYRYSCPEAKNYINSLLEEDNFDIIWIDHTNIAQYLPNRKKKNQLWILDEHNIEFQAKWRLAKNESAIPFKIFFSIEALKLFFYERRIVPLFDYWFAISNKDRERLIKLRAKSNKSFTLPVPFNTKPLYQWKKDNFNILFIGVLSWWPNRNGIIWFYKKIWPLVKKQIPQAKLIIVGLGAKQFMLDWMRKDKSIQFTGYVKDIIPYLKQAKVFISPLKMGGGIRIKILKAMSFGIPVVSTSIGAEGILASNGEEIIIEDKPDDFAKAIVNLLEDRKKSLKISKAGLNFIERHYNQRKSRDVLRKVNF